MVSSMRKTVTENQMVTVETDIVCDACGLECDTDSIEAGEYLKIGFTGGFASVFGDGNAVNADICQSCLKKHLGQFLKIASPVQCHE